MMKYARTQSVLLAV